MVKTSGEIEKEFIDSLPSATGKDLVGWMNEIKSSGIEKRNDILNWLKDVHGFGHMNAGLLTGIFFNNGQPVYANEDSLLNDQFKGCEDMQPLFMELADSIKSWRPDVQMIPKKTYVSFTVKREVAAINIKKKELRIAFDLGEKHFNETIQKAKMTGPMPRMSHMMVVSSSKDLESGLTDCLNTSYQRSHKE